jgi:hypothetical protein
MYFLNVSVLKHSVYVTNSSTLSNNPIIHRWTTEESGFCTRQGQEDDGFSSRRDQFPVRQVRVCWISDALSAEVIRPGREA